MPKTFKFLRWTGKKAVAFCVLSIVLATAIVGVTLAFLFDKTDPIKNTFPPSDIEILMSGNSITNTGDVTAYIRVALVITWVNHTDGTTLSIPPKEDVDYMVHFNTENHWKQGSDGFWYYTVPVAPAEKTAQLIRDVSILHDKLPSGYDLNVQILADSIQTTPAEAIKSSWGVTVNPDGSLNVGGTANEG